MATCLGHKQGTGCYHRSRCTQKRVNWERWQLCHGCARILHPEYYKGKKNHGVNKPRDIEASTFAQIEEAIITS